MSVKASIRVTETYESNFLVEANTWDELHAKVLHMAHAKQFQFQPCDVVEQHIVDYQVVANRKSSNIPHLLDKETSQYIAHTGCMNSEGWTWLVESGFFTAPASRKYHGNYAGGLLKHSTTVTRELLLLTESHNLQWKRMHSPYVVGMFHDLCKHDLYQWNSETGDFEYNPDADFKRHGEKSVELIEEHLFKLTDEEKACIRWHMGAFDEKENWKLYNEAIEKYPNVLWTHTADMVASQVKRT